MFLEAAAAVTLLFILEGRNILLDLHIHKRKGVSTEKLQTMVHSNSSRLTTLA